jgi:peptidyl-prolyl cis-trans isomerase SurA
MKQIIRLMTGAVFAAALAGGFNGAAKISPSFVPNFAANFAPNIAWAQDASIVAVVNGQLITTADVASRTQLLALSTGMQLTPDMMQRMAPQITRELIDQTLQMQEINKRGIVVPETDILGAVQHIEQNNNMQPGQLRTQLQAHGVNFLTLVAQLRTEIGWQDVLHQVLGQNLQPTPGDIAAETKALKSRIGSTEYQLAEIFIPVTDPQDDQTAKDFANTVIQQLRQGAPFPIVAAQFSQADSALQGGSIGFTPLNQLDPSVAAVVQTMPTGAISNPIRVPGGYYIIQMQGTHTLGTDMTTMVSMRQVFVPYTTPITNGQVGPAQAAQITKLVNDGHNVHSCSDMEALNNTYGKVRPADPGPVNLSTVTPPAFQALLANIPIGQVSQPLVAPDGASIVIICSRASNPVGLPSTDAITNAIVNQRIQLESQQLLDNLRHRSIITQNGA